MMEDEIASLRGRKEVLKDYDKLPAEPLPLLYQLKASEKKLRNIVASLWAIPFSQQNEQDKADAPLLDDAVYLCDDRIRDLLVKHKGQEWVDERISKAIKALARRGI